MVRTALVTGGTRGIGRAVAIALKSDGHRVAVAYHGNEEAARAFAHDTSIPTYKFDVSDFAACETALKQIEQAVGPVDILVNNAGITRDVQLHKMTPAQWHDVIGTDLTSCFNLCRLVIGGMRERGFGRIVNISSINGQKGQFGQTNYAAAKAGVLGFTKALALESAVKGITVNAIAPGYVATDMVAAVPQEILAKIVAQIPVGRLGHAEEIAGIVQFLVSDKAAFITGSTITANGGQYLV
ncbi:3-oxoacyl-[acyl-carrier-protein] reductase [Enhydrobacter aerosaccus]|uniref:3-oxoacyl-[acyl-carrier-protein] reductase n=1 Tax=Enhydrobacter aerosaccus TaxID=225324 RepID=A0A1T4SQF1_9HYPH|nr:acetoacetyl-CoA reductase [Enhydrobacter aerosaccus]SKA30118.1 3-oxoacyl-[acyl-carrier-protein] reductase [Enhydrobacter aerosaccus]